MNMINQFLAELSTDSRSMLYSGFGAIMHVVMLIFLIIQARHASLNKKNVLQLFVAYYVAFFAGNSACNILGGLTGGVIPKINLGVAFSVFILVMFILLRITKAPVLQLMDIAVPTFILGRGIGIIGCLFPGCCHGFPATWGIYSHNAGTTVVPTVLFDILLSIAIVVYMLLSKKKLPAPGVISANGILLFGVLRYAIDVLRDNNKLISGITVEGICGIIYVLGGLILLYIIDKKTKKTTAADEVPAATPT